MSRWRTLVELTWDIDPKDEKPGDTEDVAWRGFERVRPSLNELLKEGGFAHYHIIKAPERCED